MLIFRNLVAIFSSDPRLRHIRWVQVEQGIDAIVARHYRAPVGAFDLDILAADTYQPDNSVQFDENQTSPVHLGLPELAENLKFIIDRAETGSSPI